MDLTTLFHLPMGVRLLRIGLFADTVVLEATTASCGASQCPRCQTPSRHVHSSYTRTIADVPCSGHQVIVRLRARKLRCRNDLCPQRVFTERLAATVRPWARKTTRLQDLLRAVWAPGRWARG